MLRPVESAALLLASVAVAAQAPLPQVSPIGVGCGVSSPTLSMSPPIVGETCLFRLAPPTTAAWTALLWSVAPTSPASLPGGCVAYLDATTMSVAGLAAPTVDSLQVAIPNDPAWLSVSLAAQAVQLPTAAALGFDLSNGVTFAAGARRGPLHAQPSAPGTHLNAVAAMGPDTWLDLGVPQPDPVYGLATGREYTPRMAWSSSLQGAFLTGESGHGYVHTQTGRYIDDVWFLDFAALKWVCVKPGSEVATLSLSLNADQFEVDALGELVPVAQLGHGYEFVAFDELSQNFLMQPMPNTYWVGSMPQRLNWLPSALFPASQYRSPWLFDTVAGVWRRAPAGNPAPNFNTASRAITVHGMAGGRFLYFDTANANQNRVWWYDANTLTWQDQATTTPAPSISGNGVSCYDPNHHRMWYYGVDATAQQARLWYYDIAAARWHQTTASNTPTHTVIYTTANRGLSYDQANDQVLLKLAGSGTTPPSFVPFDVATNSWLAAATPPASLGVNWSWQHTNVCYASGHNVHVLHVAGGNNGTGRIVVYRRN